MALMEILTGYHADGSPVVNPEASDTRYRSITDHLYRLLNARRGAIQHMPDYGLPDLSELYQGLPYSVEILIREIKDQIERFEPRLRDVNIEYKPLSYVDCIVHLGITAKSCADDDISIETYFYSGGRARVE